MNQKEIKKTKSKNNLNASQVNKQKTKNKSKSKRENRTYRPQSKISKNNSKVEQEPCVPQSFQKEINDLKLLIEKKNNEINYINKENEKNTKLLLEKEKEIMNSQNKIETVTNEITKLKNKNENLVKEVNNKEDQIKELNYTLMEYKQKIISNEETDKFINKLKDSFVESNNDMNRTIENFENEINILKNKLNESEIKNSKLTFDNNILSNKIESIYKEKDEQIKVIESLYQKQIDNCNKNISQLNDKLLQSLKENSNKISSDEESFNKRIEQEKKMKLLEVENIKFKKEIEGMMHEKEELKKISLDKDKIIEKLEVEIEKYDYENNNNNKDKFKKEEYEKEINNLKKENEELKVMFKKMTQGINEANVLYNEKLVNFNKQILLKNNKLLEYKNKISVLKVKINELHEELSLLRGSTTNTTNNVNNNSFFNTSFINNSIINTNTSQKNTDKLSSNSVLLNKNYSTINNRLNTQTNNNNNDYQKKAIGVSAYNSKTVDRRDIKENGSLTKMNSMTNINKSKDDINNVNKEKKTFNNENYMAQIKKEILIPQTPQVNKENKEYIDKNEIKESKISQTPMINKELFMPQIKNDMILTQTPQINKEFLNPTINKENVENKNPTTNKNSDIQDFINKNKEEDKNRINFLKEYKEILDKYGSNLSQNINENK